MSDQLTFKGIRWLLDELQPVDTITYVRKPVTYNVVKDSNTYLTTNELTFAPPIKWFDDEDDVEDVVD